MNWHSGGVISRRHTRRSELNLSFINTFSDLVIRGTSIAVSWITQLILLLPQIAVLEKPFCDWLKISLRDNLTIYPYIYSQIVRKFDLNPFVNLTARDSESNKSLQTSIWLTKFFHFNPASQLGFWCANSIPRQKVTHPHNFSLRNQIRLKTYSCTKSSLSFPVRVLSFRSDIKFSFYIF